MYHISDLRYGNKKHYLIACIEHTAFLKLLALACRIKRLRLCAHTTHKHWLHKIKNCNHPHYIHTCNTITMKTVTLQCAL